MQLECVLFAFMLTSFGLLQIVFDFKGIQTDLFGEVEGSILPINECQSWVQSYDLPAFSLQLSAVSFDLLKPEAWMMAFRIVE
jgi:hypothetical protein